MINIGVPQGSILGTLLFLIYVNELFNATLTKPRLFADDTCFVISNSSPLYLELQCNLDLQNLCNWCNANKLQINPEKSCIFHIPSKLNSSLIDLNVYYIDSLVSCQKTCKYLEVYLDFKLNFLHHIRQVESKVAKAVGILGKLRSLLPKSTLLLLYHALIHPHLIYALPLWDCSFSSYIQKLQRLQNKAIRIICNTSRYSSANILFYKLGILKIGDLYQYETGKLMYQYSQNNLPTGVSSLFVNLSTIHNRQTRSQSLKSLYLNFQLIDAKGLSNSKETKFGTLSRQN